MIFKRFLFFIPIILSSLNIRGQQTVDIPNHRDRWVDTQGNIYLQSTFSIEKLNSQGKNVARWRAPKGMSISTFDPSNNHKILVFFKEFSQIIYLNQNLVELSPLTELSTSPNEEITAVCWASNGELWIATRLQNVIARVGGNFAVKYSFSFRPFGEVSQIDKMYEINQQLYILSDNRWLVFDLFGQPITKIIREGMLQAQITYPITLYVEGNNLMAFDIRTQDSQPLIKLSVPAVAAYRYGNRTYLFDSNRLTILQ